MIDLDLDLDSTCDLVDATPKLLGILKPGCQADVRKQGLALRHTFEGDELSIWSIVR